VGTNYGSTYHRLVTAHTLDNRQTDTLPISLAIAKRSLKASERLFGTLSPYLNLNYLRAYATRVIVIGYTVIFLINYLNI